MKQKLLPILFISTIYLLATPSIEQHQRLEGKPVDEGHKLVHKKDTTKGTKDINNSYQYQEQSLKEIKDDFIIQRENITHAPFTLLHYDVKTQKITTLDKEKKLSNTISFSVSKSALEIGDRILVINNRNSKAKQAPKGKEVIIEIEIKE